MTIFSPLRLDDVPAMASLEHDAFNMPEEACVGWIERTGVENWRGLWDDKSELQGGLIRIPMGQWFGGKAVSMTGLAGVAVSTLGRGRGVGKALMRGTLEEMRAEGTGLSALYGSTTSFYRRCGYERSGSRYVVEVPLRELTCRGGPLEVRPLGEADQVRVEALQAAHVRGHGCLKRGPYLWQRVRGPRGMTAKGFGFFRGETLEGYTYLVKEAGQGFQDNTVEASDLVLTTPDAVSTFLGLLAGHRAFFTTARWSSPPCSPLLMLMDEPWSYKVGLFEHWLLRVVHLPNALTQRGYPSGVVQELHLVLEDPWFPENSGAWVLRVAGGTAELEQGGRAEFKLGIGAFASLYSGFASPRDLVLSGQLEAPESALGVASEIFGGAVPELTDFF